MNLKCLNLLTIILLVFVAACSDQEKEVPAEQPIKNDTPLVDLKKTSNAYTPVDISPMDMIYFPVDFPVLKMAGNASANPVVRVIYSRPHREGRKIFGQLLKYGEPWRLGANEATEIEFFQPVRINGKSIRPGRYILYCIPMQDKWIMIFNNNIYAWGLKIPQNKNAVQVEIPVTVAEPQAEFFTMWFEKTNQGADLVMTWDDVMTRMPVEF